MNKQEFLSELGKKISGLPKEEIDDRLEFYEELIDDRIEAGYPEELAVENIGTPEEVSAQILSDTPLSLIVKEKVKPEGRKRSAWEIILLVLGSPIWLSLLIAVFAVLLSVYAVFWSLVICLWAVFIALAACFLAGLVGFVWYLVHGNIVLSLGFLGAGLVSGGLAILLFFASREATKGVARLTRGIALGIKRAFMRKDR